MSKKLGTVTLIVALLALVLSCVALGAARKASQPALSPDKDIQYVLYLGTNDKDSNEPVFTPEQAKEEAEKILIDHFGGYTIQEASGGWIDGDSVYQEYTLVIYLSDTNLEAVHTAAEELIEVFRQSSVLIQANQTETEFFSGE